MSNLYRSRWNTKNYVALKIGVSGSRDEVQANHERNMTRALEANPSHPGYQFVRSMLDTFEIPGPAGRGKHICIVFEPMREPLWMFQERIPDCKLPVPLLKPYIRLMLHALDYLHTQCHIVHTGLSHHFHPATTYNFRLETGQYLDWIGRSICAKRLRRTTIRTPHGSKDRP